MNHLTYAICLDVPGDIFFSVARFTNLQSYLPLDTLYLYKTILDFKKSYNVIYVMEHTEVFLLLGVSRAGSLSPPIPPHDPSP